MQPTSFRQMNIPTVRPAVITSQTGPWSSHGTGQGRPAAGLTAWHPADPGDACARGGTVQGSKGMARGVQQPGSGGNAVNELGNLRNARERGEHEHQQLT